MWHRSVFSHDDKINKFDWEKDMKFISGMFICIYQHHNKYTPKSIINFKKLLTSHWLNFIIGKA